MQHTHTHSHFMALWNFFRDNLGEPVPEETFTHSHLSWSSVVPYLLYPSITIHHPWHPPCSIYVPDSLFPQSLSKFSLVYVLAWHPPLHTPYISSPNHCLLFAAHAIPSQPVCCSTEIMSSNPSLSLSCLPRNQSFTLTSHIHLTIFITAH